MWKIIQEVLPITLVILLMTQYVVPIIFNGTTWWLFRKEKKTNETVTADPSTLLEEIKATKVVIDTAKAKADVVKQKVDGNLKTAEDLKKEADNLK